MNRREFLTKTMAAGGLMMTGQTDSALASIDNIDDHNDKNYGIIESAVSYWTIKNLGFTKVPASIDFHKINENVVRDFKDGGIKIYDINGEIERYSHFYYLEDGKYVFGHSHVIDDIRTVDNDPSLLMFKISPLDNIFGRRLIEEYNRPRRVPIFQLAITWGTLGKSSNLDYYSLRLLGAPAFGEGIFPINEASFGLQRFHKKHS